MAWRRAESLEWTVRGTDGVDVVVSVDRSGVIRWNYDAPDPDGFGIVMVAVLGLLNVLSHRVAFCSGWTVRARIDGRLVAKARCRSHGTAREAAQRLKRVVETDGSMALGRA